MLCHWVNISGRFDGSQCHDLQGPAVRKISRAAILLGLHDLPNDKAPTSSEPQHVHQRVHNSCISLKPDECGPYPRSSNSISFASIRLKFSPAQATREYTSSSANVWFHSFFNHAPKMAVTG